MGDAPTTPQEMANRGETFRCTCTPEGCDAEGDPGCVYCQSLDGELPCPMDPSPEVEPYRSSAMWLYQNYGITPHQHRRLEADGYIIFHPDDVPDDTPLAYDPATGTMTALEQVGFVWKPRDDFCQWGGPDGTGHHSERAAFALPVKETQG